jgi:BASS family bile acid:Na+ symporter
MDMKNLVMLAFQVSIMCTVFGFGLKATPEDLLHLLRRPGLLARSLVAVLVIMPVVAVALARLFDFRQVVEIALVALALSPMPPLLPQRTTKTGGEPSYGLGLLTILSLLSIASIPLSVEVLGRFFGQSLAMAPGAVAKVVLVAALLPLAAGMATRAVVPGIAERIAPLVSWVPRVLMPLGVLALLAGNWRAIWAAVGDSTVLAIVVFVAAGLVVGHLPGRPEPEHSVVLALASACRHPAIALSTAAANYPDMRFGGTILLYLLVSFALSIPYRAWQRRRGSEASEIERGARRAA